MLEEVSVDFLFVCGKASAATIHTGVFICGNNLLDLTRPCRHNDDSLTQIDCLVNVVCDHDHGDFFLPLDSQDLFLHLDSCQRIQRTERLIQQQYGWIPGKTSGNRHALGHTAGQLRGIGIFKAFQSHQFQMPCNVFLSLCLFHVPDAETDIVLDFQPRQQPVILEYHAALCIRSGNGMTVPGNAAILVGYQTADDFQKRTLSASAVSYDRDKLSFFYGKINVLQHLKRSAVLDERFVQMGNRNDVFLFGFFHCYHLFLLCVLGVSFSWCDSILPHRK